MKFRRETKIIFVILAIMIVIALVYMIVEYPKLKASSRPIDEDFSAIQLKQPPGTCAPDSAACGGNVKLCMEMNKNLTCN